MYCHVYRIQPVYIARVLINNLFSDGYNSYLEVVGHFIEANVGAGVKGKEGANKIRDSTKFIDFLSAMTDDEQLEGSDLLYLIINDIVRAII